MARARTTQDATPGDVTTPANPDNVEQIRQMVQGAGRVATKAGPEDIKRFGQEP